jgi:hypothetical protein
MLVTYGEVAQATYDNLGQDRCSKKTYGNALQPPDQLLEYLGGNYRLAPAETGRSPSTADM